MEMDAVTMAARMAHMLKEALEEAVSIGTIVILTDSEVALGWLGKYSVNKDAGVLVKNRIQEIRRIIADLMTFVRFGHVRTNENLADLAVPREDSPTS
ncbi:hypothetical protein GCK32_009159 [Trichostrongylus colubriformis]|uniref:Uncharacterized protein n=1 Tax=Trichostrongylus colubriformis TaxID=6319 RepID=A0AAN8EVJ9_TRICO